MGEGYGHIQSLILGCTLIVVGFLTFMIGLVSDLMAANRRILSDTQYHIRRMEYDSLWERQAGRRASDTGWEPYVVTEKGAEDKEKRQKVYNMC